MSEWNIYQCSSGVVLQETTGAADVEFYYTVDESLTGSCAAYTTYLGEYFTALCFNTASIT
jgi:hypothetical protein